MVKILTKDICNDFRTKFVLAPEQYDILIDILKEEYCVLFKDAKEILEGINIDKIVKKYDFSYDDLFKFGFDNGQINQIMLGKNDGINLSGYDKNISAEELRRIREDYKKTSNPNKNNER